MKIVYGVSGEGLGHVFEALEIASQLREAGHVLKLLTYGDQACDALAAFNPLRIAGLPLYFGPRGLSLTRTLVENRRLPWFYLTHSRRLKAEVAAFEPDVFLTAYEPYTTYLAHALKRPLISMDNQNELLHLPQPKDADPIAYNLARWATQLCTRGADFYLIKSFQKAACTGGNRIRLVSPLIQADIRALRPTNGNHVLVYLTKPNPRLIEALRSVDETFYIYGHHSEHREGNLHFRRRGASYLPALESCKAIVGTTGFSLIADAVYLKKPYFGVPLRGQFEQTHNAQYLRTSGIGEYSEHPSPDDLRWFLSQLVRHRRALDALSFDPDEQADVLRELLERVHAAARGPDRELTAACR